MWLFQHSRTIACSLLLTGCQLGGNQSADPLDAGANAWGEPLSSERERDLAFENAAPMRAPHCPDNAVCLERPSTAEQACEAGLQSLIASGALIAPARCEIVAETSLAGSSRRAAVLSFHQADFQQPYWVALGGSDGYGRLVELMNVSSGVNTALQLTVSQLQFVDLVLGGEPELRIEMRSVVDDHDCSGEFSWRTHRTDVGICLDEAGNVYCLAPLPRSLRRIETRYDPATDRESDRLVEHYAIELSFEPSELVARELSGRVPDEVRAWLGRHRMRDAATLARELPFPN